MYIKLTNNVPQSYSIRELRSDNPQVSFPAEIPEDTLAEYGVYPVKPSEQPVPGSFEVVEATGFLQLEDGSWTQAWHVRPMTSEELARKSNQEDEQRRYAYQQEADPLFFKWQRNEATKEEWLSKIAEIKLRFTSEGTNA